MQNLLGLLPKVQEALARLVAGLMICSKADWVVCWQAAPAEAF